MRLNPHKAVVIRGYRILRLSLSHIDFNKVDKNGILQLIDLFFVSFVVIHQVPKMLPDHICISR